MSRPIETQALLRERQGIKGSPSQQAAEFISRYPNLNGVELDRLIDLYAELSALDMALMISDDNLGLKLDRFLADHRSKLRTPFRQYAVFIAVAVSGIGAIVWSMMIAQ
jgi:hypothetical protein